MISPAGFLIASGFFFLKRVAECLSCTIYLDAYVKYKDCMCPSEVMGFFPPTKVENASLFPCA